jgi:hypothetical protein
MSRIGIAISGGPIELYRRSGIDLPIISPFARGPDARSRFEAAIGACAPATLATGARPS